MLKDSMQTSNKPEDNQYKINWEKNVANTYDAEHGEKEIKVKSVILDWHGPPREVVDESSHVECYAEKYKDPHSSNNVR